MQIKKLLGRLVVVALAVGVVSIVIAACGSSSSSNSSGAKVGSTSLGATKASGGKKRIVFVTVLLADANWAGVNACFSDEAAKYGYLASIVAPSTETNDVPHSVQLISEAISQHPDALVVVPLDPPAYDNVLQQAKAAHVPVIAMGLDTHTPDERVAAVITDFNKFGQQGADLLAKATGGHATIGVSITAPDVANQVTAVKAFKQRIAQKYPGMKVVTEIYNTTDFTQGTEKYRSMFTAYPNINAVWSPDGRGGIDAANAARELGKKPGQITIIGADHLPQVISDLQSKWEYASSNFVSCNWGKYAVDAAHQYFTKGKVTPQVQLVPNIIWTQKHPQ